MKSGYCGCGRRSTTSPCSYCRQNRPPPRPDPKTLPIEYLITCVQELTRRRDEIDAALEGAA